ncbi:unnamed protein product [Caenorhabditis brenneri]
MAVHPSIFILLLFFITPIHAQDEDITPEDAVLCSKLEKGSDVYDFCMETIRAVRSFEAFFDKFHFGSPDMLAAINENHMITLKEICDRFKNCPKTNRLNCFLPRLDTSMVCRKCNILRTPYGACIKKFMTTKIKSDALESYLKDFTNRGVAQKCTDLRYPNAVMAGIFFECGLEAETSFNKLNEELRLIYECSIK